MIPCAVILTAISEEYIAVRTHLTNVQKVQDSQSKIYERGGFAGWEVVIAEVGEGNIQAALGTERAIAYFNPSVILFVGVAGGIKDLVIGDVVVANRVYYYEFRKIDKTDGVRPYVLNVDSKLIEIAKHEAKQSGWQAKLEPSPNQSPRVIVKPIASGEKVFASTQSREFQLLRQYYNDAIAVEMEGKGFLEAVNNRVPALIIRGISDLIDGKNAADADGFQKIAARHASAFAFEILAKYKPKISKDIKYLSHKDLSKELENINNQLLASPKDFSLLRHKAEIAKFMGDIDLMDETYQKLIALKPNSSKTRISYVYAYKSIGDLNRALSILNDALKFDKNNADYFKIQGEILLISDRSSEALQAYKDALELNPDDYTIMTKIGIVLREIGQYKHSLKFLNLALKISPTYRAAKYEKKKTYSKIFQGGIRINTTY
ncbi:MAG: hypothetical protein PUP91_28600 [Rhizonema sp. PD37]|nr:hypothetical protein [Rhizonema sp. PD37]